MSNRQIKKILKQNRKDQKETSSEEEEKITKKVSFFSAVEVDEIESEEEEENESQKEAKKIDSFSKKKTQPKKKPKKNEKQKNLDDFEIIEENLACPADPPEVTKTESVFKRQKKWFDSRMETDKLFKNSKKSQKSLHQSGKGLALTPTITHYQKADYLLAMEKASDPTKNIFYFDISKGYSKIHPTYIECIESNDENMLNQFLARYPLHVESLFQMIMVFQMQGQFENVSILIERLLYSFQMSFHYQYSVISNDSEIDITMNSYNRIFMRTLAMHADCLGRKGCVRTALEVVKLIFSLSPREDPLGCIFLVDYYSIRAKKFNYFFYFLENYMAEVYGYGSALSFPHLLYSLALAKTLLSGYTECSEQDLKEAQNIKSLSEVFSKNSTVVLLLAVNWHREFAEALLMKLGQAEKKENVSKVCEIYSRRNEDLWKPYVNWLKTVSSQTIEVPDKETQFEDLLEKYTSLDSNDFSFDVRTVIPQDMEIQQRRRQGNLSINSSPLYLFFATFLPWNYID